MYLQKNTEFAPLLERITSENPDYTDDEIVSTVCQRYNFDPKLDVPMEYHEYFIPLEGFGVTQSCKQFVLGRIHQLRPYYIQTSKYITLTLPDDVWSDRWSFSLAMNDLFIYCAATAKRNCKDRNYIPIRIVLDNRDLEFFDRGIASHHKMIHGKEESSDSNAQMKKLERRRSQRRFDRTKQGLSPVDERFPNKTVVLARELCQLTTLLHLNMYQSKKFPTLLFIDYLPRNMLDNNSDFYKVDVS